VRSRQRPVVALQVPGMSSARTGGMKRAEDGAWRLALGDALERTAARASSRACCTACPGEQVSGMSDCTGGLVRSVSGPKAAGRGAHTRVTRDSAANRPRSGVIARNKARAASVGSRWLTTDLPVPLALSRWRRRPVAALQPARAGSNVAEMDGFRCLAFRSGDATEAALQVGPTADRRYFPPWPLRCRRALPRGWCSTASW